MNLEIVAVTSAFLFSSFLIYRGVKHLYEDRFVQTNLNELAREITLEEGKLKSVSIAQVKEVLKITMTKLSRLPQDDLFRLLRRYNK